ncbi:MAG: excinuclease ABC subunit UvrC [Ruminococcaceae bacterium]|nr:excinuclease ABC subunit UvrC [Oscillospiraceae bacterium]
MTLIERLRDKANSLPMQPGVYIMKDADGAVIYVGKSKKLKNRVTSYFVGSTHSYKTAKMVSLVKDFDYIVCKTEIEALTLENVLIKKHSPKYNIKLKDAKSYPYIKVTGEEFPKLFVTRERKSDRAKYFGPYQSSQSAHTALDTVMKIFTLATCKRSFPKDIGRERPCIYRDMGRCIAPCTGKVSSSEYRSLVKCAEWVLDGNIKETAQMLRGEMEEASQNLEFERAAAIRDSIFSLERLSEKQKVVADSKVNRDVFAIYTSETEGVLAMLSIRSGALVNKSEFILSAGELTSPEDVISLIADYYDGTGNIPREVMLDFSLSDEDTELLSEYLSLNTKYKVSVKIPERGDGRALCDMALENARESARQYKLEGEREDKNLKRLTELLGLSEVPRRIEAYDISNIGNENITASMVVWSGGKMKKSDYRTFTVKTTLGADDYGSMREVLGRRFSHIGDGSLSLGEQPDLILLDGGEAHVGVVRALMEERGIDIPLFGMVKDDYHKTRAITDGDRDISIAKEMGVYSFVYNIQEEAHRFALKNSQGAKIKTMTRSTLEKIKGIGPKKAKLLLSSMPLAKIRTSSKNELSKIQGISEADAENIYQYYHKGE